MNKSVQYILWMWVGLMGISCLYFLGLVVGVPFWVELLANLTWIAFVVWMYRRLVASIPEDPGMGRITVMVIAVCSYQFIFHATELADKHGGWDAFAIWNFHARYLADPVHWQNLFLNTDTEHPDYPVGQPALLAFFFRCCSGRHQELISYLLALLCTFSVPVLLLVRLWSKNRVVALVAFYILCTNLDFIGIGVSQYADMLVAVLLLAAFIAIEEAEERPEWAGVSAFLLCCTAFTKNEGMILSGLMFLFYAARFCRRSSLVYTAMGVMLPLVALLAFKSVCPVHNDMISSLSPETWKRVLDWSRYTMIYTNVNEVMDMKFKFVEVGLLLAFVVSLFRKILPRQSAYFIFSCFCVYLFIYVITPHDLEWHLHTSLDRLLLQLMPITAYITAVRLSGFGFSFSSNIGGSKA